MPFTTVFGNQPVYSAEPQLLALALAAATTTLSWPLETGSGASILATIIDVTPGAPARTITLPDARNGSPGAAITFSNLGADTFSVLDNLGNVVVTVASGLIWTIYLQTNATQAGTWRTFQQGAGVSAANAAALAGAGLKAITTTLNVKMLPVARAVNYVIVLADRANIQEWTGGVGQFTLPDPAVVGSDWFVGVKNAGSGTLTVVPTAGTIDGAATKTFNVDDSSYFYTDGANFFTFGRGQTATSIFDFISMSVAGTGTLTLAGVQLNRISYQFTGILTGNRTIVVPATVQQYWVSNATTGAFTLTVKTALGTGVIIPQGSQVLLYCNGSDVVDATTGTTTQVRLLNGIVAAPGLSWDSEQTSGWYRNVAFDFRFAVAGADALSIQANQFLFRDGTPLLPGISFLSDTNTGIYRSGADDMRLAVAGADVFQIVGGSAMPARVLSGQLGVQDGAVGAPSFSFISDPDTGMYHAAADSIAFSTAGVARVSITIADFNSLVFIRGPDGLVGTPGYSFISDPDTGLYRAGGNFLGIATGGTLRAGWDGTTAFYQRNQQWNQDGTNLLPGYSFENDPDTGIFRFGANVLGFAIAGLTRATMSGTLFDTGTIINTTDGAVGTPAYSFATDPDTGIYRDGVNQFSFSAGGVRKLAIFASGSQFDATILNTDGVVGTPAYTFTSDPDTGIYRAGANLLRVSVGATDATTWFLNGAVGQTLVQDGTAPIPGFAFTADTDTGFYRAGNNDIGLAVAGAQLMRFTATNVDLSLGVFRIPDGAVGTPSYTFANDPDTGMYRAGADSISFVAGGVSQLTINSNAIIVTGTGGTNGVLHLQDKSAATPSVTFLNDQDTGFYRDTANQIAIALGGVTAGQIAQGTFTGTLTGYAVNPTGTVNYQRIGNHVTLWVTGNIIGTSNATTLTMTGLPAIITPTATRKVFCAVRDNTNDLMTALALPDNTGAITFALQITGAVANRVTTDSNSFTAANSKGIIVGWMISYTM